MNEPVSIKGIAVVGPSGTIHTVYVHIDESHAMQLFGEVVAENVPDLYDQGYTVRNVLIQELPEPSPVMQEEFEKAHPWAAGAPFENGHYRLYEIDMAFGYFCDGIAVAQKRTEWLKTQEDVGELLTKRYGEVK